MNRRAGTRRSSRDDPARTPPQIAVLESLYLDSSIGLAVLDTDLRLVAMNAALERICGLSAESSRGRRIGELLTGAWTDPPDERLQVVLETGVPALSTRYRGRPPADGAPDHVWTVSSFRLTGATGDVLGVASAVVDLSEGDWSSERLDLLNEVSERIGSVLDVVRTAEELVAVAVPRLADLAAVDLLEGVAEGDEPASGPVGRAAVLRRAAVSSVTEDAPEATYRTGEVMTFHPSTPYAGCLSTGRPLLIPVLDQAADWLAQDPARGAKILRAGVHSLMTVPVRARDVTLGLAHFYRWGVPEPFDEDDLALARGLVARAAICIDNARRYTLERQSTLALQHSLLPRGRTPQHVAVETAHTYRPAAGRSGIAGDCFDVIALSGARVGLVVADVAGRGITAIARAGRLLTAIRTLAGLDLSPDELLAQLDILLGRAVEAELTTTGAGVGASCLYAVYDPVTGRCSLASAGHPVPAVVRPGRPAELLDMPVGPPLGVGGMPFEPAEFDLPDGSVLALFTNGLVQDRAAGPDAGVPGLLRALDRTDLPLDRLGRQVCAAALGTHQPDDDAVLLLARTRALAADRVATWDLAADPAGVAHARTLARDQLRAWDLADIAPVTELLVSELVTNAIRYGRSPIRLRLIRERALICEVSDASSTSPHLRLAAATDEGGRGLFMIAHIADAWGTRYTPTGKTIWTRQAIADGAS